MKCLCWLFPAIGFLALPLLAQVQLSPEILWFNAANSPLPTDRINYVLVDSAGTYWFACGDQDSLPGGLVRFDGTTWQLFQPDNSGIPVSDVMHVDMDSQGILWVATLGGGIARFDGTGWQVFDVSNSPMPTNDIWTLTAEPGGSVWVGTWADGLVHYDGQHWQWFHPSNSPLGSAQINFIRLDAMGLKWIGTDDYGLQSFDGQNWQSHGQGRLSPGLNTAIFDMVIDPTGTRWIGGLEGGVGGVVARYQDTVWTEIESLSGSFDYAVSYKGMALDTAGTPWLATRSGLVHIYADTLWQLVALDSLSGLPIQGFWALSIDQRNNKIVTIAFLDSALMFYRGAGVLFYNEDGVSLTGIGEPKSLPGQFKLHPNYPNPFNPTTTIEVDIPLAEPIELTVYNLLGQAVATLFAGQLPPGRHRFVFDARSLASGVYLIVLKSPQGIQVRKAILLR